MKAFWARKEILLQLDEQQQLSELQIEVWQAQRAGWVNRHYKKREKDLIHGAAVLVFQSRWGLLPGKLNLQWSGPFWILRVYNDGTFPLGTLQGQYVPKLVNGFRLQLYHGVMPDNPFQMLIKETKILDILPKEGVLSQLVTPSYVVLVMSNPRGSSKFKQHVGEHCSSKIQEESNSLLVASHSMGKEH